MVKILFFPIFAEIISKMQDFKNSIYKPPYFTLYSPITEVKKYD